jgi:DNA-binding NarL/FixJ family response regulator
LSARDLKGARVLLVEDQMIVAVEVEVMLRAAGCEVVGPVGTLQAAITLAHEEALDLAVLDVNLDGEKVYQAAEELQTRGIPFILATGYGESTLPENGAISLA